VKLRDLLAACGTGEPPERELVAAAAAELDLLLASMLLARSHANWLSGYLEVAGDDVALEKVAAIKDALAELELRA
jgi:hypothetical protein